MEKTFQEALDELIAQYAPLNSSASILADLEIAAYAMNEQAAADAADDFEVGFNPHSGAEP